jgi:putative serine protease PepD
VVADSPAEAADLQVDDILTAINGEAVSSAREAVRAIRRLNPGDTVTLDVTRGDESLSLEAALGSMVDARTEMPFPMMPPAEPPATPNV